MSEILYCIHYIQRIFLYVKFSLTAKFPVIIVLPAISTYTIVSDNVTHVWCFLFITLILDFITGIYASFIETIKLKKRLGLLKSGKLNKLNLLFETITSEKLRRSVVKTVCYILFVLFMYTTEKLFFISSFNISYISEQHTTLTLVALALCISIEIYSIIFENIRRSGYDIVKSVIKIIRKFRILRAKIKKEFE